MRPCGSLTVIACMARDGILANTPIYYGLGVSLLTFVAVSLMSQPAPALRSTAD